MKHLSIVLAALLMVSCSSSSKSPEESRKELGQMNIQYNEAAFIDSAKNGDIVALNLFLTAGMDINARDSLGRVAYEFSSIPRNANVEWKEAINQQGRDDRSRGTTALMAAAVMGRSEIIKILLNKGADVNAEDRVDLSALGYAVLKQDSNITDNLLRAGASPNGGKEPNTIMLAVMTGNEDIVKALVEAGGNVNSRYQKGHTLLMLATQDHLTNTVNFLIERGSDVNSSNAQGMTALMIAKEKGFADIVDMLKRHGAIEGQRQNK